MKLTEEQRQAVDYPENLLLRACPGSGKTRTLVVKLLRIIEGLRGTSRKVLCITYTRAAAQEIENRLRTLGSSGDSKYYSVSTIHAFCLRDILSRFHWLTDAYKGGFEVIVPGTEEYSELALKACRDAGLSVHSNERRWLLEGFEYLNREVDGTPIFKPPLTSEAACAFWQQLEALSFLDFPSIVYYAFRVLAESPFVTKGLAARYPWILVDEFQDTSSLQVEILRLIADQGSTRFFLVGDPHQSIYSFAGARVDLFDSFSQEIDAAEHIQLSGNFRSSAPIIDHAEAILPRGQHMKPLGKYKGHTEQPILRDFGDTFSLIKQAFLPRLVELGIPFGRAAILAPQWPKLYWLGRNLRDSGVPISGPGARPYRRDSPFAELAESLCAYLTTSDRSLFRRIERALVNFLIGVGIPDVDQIGHFERRRCLLRIIASAEAAMESHSTIQGWLEEAASSISTILFESHLLPTEKDDVLMKSAESMLADMRKQNIDPDQSNLQLLGLQANPKDCLRLLTMHKSKGREFEAVALIGLHEGKIPHWQNIEKDDVEEARRIFYVAITRAQRHLLYISDTEDDRDHPSRFLSHLPFPEEPEVLF